MENEEKHIRLDDIGNKQPFKVPPGYFDTFEHQLFSKIEELETGKKPQGFLFFLKPILSVAASFVIAFLLIYYPIKAITSKTAISQNKATNSELEYLSNIFATDHDVVECIETTAQKETIDNAVIESVLLASMSDIELIELN